MSGLAGALLRYRVLANIVGTTLVLLVFGAIPAQIAGHPGPVQIIGALHGYLFIVYLLLIVDLTRRSRLPLVHMLLVMAAGLVPFATFYAERRTTRWVREHALPSAELIDVAATETSIKSL